MKACGESVAAPAAAAAPAVVLLTFGHRACQEDQGVEVDGREESSAAPQSSPLERRPVSSDSD